MHDMFRARRLLGEWFDDADNFVSDTMSGTAAFLNECGVTLAALATQDEPQLRKSAKARQEHADALEAEGQYVLAGGAA